jgi:DNA-binding GntR family transcriptional regulator
MKKDELIKHIKDEIIRNKLAPGQRIVELQLAKELQVSRNKVREAMLALEQEDFVEIVPNSGQKSISDIHLVIYISKPFCYA